MSLLLTGGTQSPENDLRLLNEERMIGGRLQTGSRADRAVHINGQTTATADDVVVIVPHTRLEASRVPGRLDAPDETCLLQDAQIVVHCLKRERSEAFARSLGNGFHIPMLPLAQYRQKDGEARRSDPQTGTAEGFVKCDFLGSHAKEYSL